MRRRSRRAGGRDAARSLDKAAAFAQVRGLRLGAVGGERGAAPAFEALGLRRLYLGDEAIVETGRFPLEGRAIRKVRQPWTRIEKAGYTLSMETLSTPRRDDGRARGASPTRGAPGSYERGFTMAPRRLGGAHQHDTVVAIARDAEGSRPRLPALRTVPTGARRSRSRSCDATRRPRTG